MATPNPGPLALLGPIFAPNPVQDWITDYRAFPAPTLTPVHLLCRAYSHIDTLIVRAAVLDRLGVGVGVGGRMGWGGLPERDDQG